MNYFLGDFTSAIENHKSAPELAPGNFIEWGNLVDACRFAPGNEQNAMDAYRRAIELCEQALAINPDDLRAVARLSTHYAFTERIDRAEAMLLRLAERQDAPGTAHFFAARTTIQLDDMEPAYEYLREALELGWSRSLVLRDGEERFERL